MISVEFYYEGEQVKGFVAQGHAGSAPQGEDLVCASISALTQTALLGLDAFLTKKPIWHMDQKGYLECWLPENLSVAEFKKAEIIIGTLELGLQSIAESYGRYLQVRKRRWTPCCLK
ncbi:MAG: ribosomal-processing cysteine protease Prp [Clostridia bacterium]|nr:ribosomal-processing cysteine protease Prp [Clostridia bacterium]